MVRFRYSAWDGTQTLVDLDAGRILDALADDIVYHGDLDAALRDLLRRGLSAGGQHIEGLSEIAEELRRRREELLARYDPSGIVSDIKERLDDVVRTEERTVRNSLGDPPDPAFAERLERLHQMPDDAATQIRQLRDYDFADTDAAAKFSALLEDLRGQAMQQFAGSLTRGLSQMSPEQMQRTKDMMAELNDMLRRRAAGEEVDFDGFMSRYGDFFPENPRDLDELLRSLAERMARMQMLLASMSPEQRVELDAVLDALMEDMDLRWQADELARQLRDAFPTLTWDLGYEFSGVDPLDLPGGLGVMDDLAQIDQLADILGLAADPALLAEIDPDQVSDLAGEGAARSLRQLQDFVRRLEDAGLVNRKSGRLELTARGMRRIGAKALRDVFAVLGRDRFGEHELSTRGALGEQTYTSRPYLFGDPFLLDVGRTLRNALLRDGPGTPVQIRPDDFEIEETERLTRTSTVLMLDLSLSMPMRDNFLAAKKVAVALHALISSKFPRDYLGIVGFSDVAHEIDPADLSRASYDFVYGTNMQHGLLLARRMLARQTAGTRQIIMITDGEPTAHIEGGVPVFQYPPVPRTLELTLREVLRCTRERIRINTFMLDASPSLRRFVEKMTELNRGRAFFTTPGDLGEYVLVDFLESRRRARRC
jgi:uncharacterized protein with von Willebrand factor type A (vWA) domain